MFPNELFIKIKFNPKNVYIIALVQSIEYFCKNHAKIITIIFI